MNNYYFNSEHPLRPYTHSLMATEGTFPPLNALRVEPEFQEGYWPCEQDGSWVQIEDHREKQGYINGEPFIIKELGSLSDGWSDTPPPPSFEEVQTDKVSEINGKYEESIRILQSGYPNSEVLSWERQAQQAKELKADLDAPAGFVRMLAATKGITPDEMATRILANAAMWEPAAAKLTAERQLMEEAALSATTIENLNNIVVQYSI